MRIRVKLMGMLKDKTPPEGTLDLPDGSSIEDALRALGIPVNIVQVFTLNGELQRDRRCILTPDIELGVLPPAGGG
jgi:hypothetical protein